MARTYPEARKWYGTKQWKALRRATLLKDPICTRCRTEKSVVADHKIPHKGNIHLFFADNNLQGMCKKCHDSFKQRQENGQLDTACDEEGYPVDAGHPWNTPR